MTGYGNYGMFRGSGWGGQGGLSRPRGRSFGRRQPTGIGGETGPRNPPALGVVMPDRRTGIGMAPGTFQPQTGGGEPYEPNGSPYGGISFTGGSRNFDERTGQYRQPGYGRMPQRWGRQPWGRPSYGPGGQFGDFDMSSIFRGIGNPYGGADYGYGSGPETDFAMPWEQTGPEPGNPGPGNGPADPGTYQQQNGGPDGNGDRDTGRGREVGSFGDWAGRMGEMGRDLWSGSYSRDSDYGPGPGTGPDPNAPEPDPGAYSGGREGDYARGGHVRRFEGGGGADGADGADVRGSGRDQAVDPSWNDFSRDWGKVFDMATISPTRGLAEVTGLADKIRDGIGWGGGSEAGPQIADAGGWSGGRDGAEMGASMNARGGGIGYAVGGEGDGRSDDIPALLSNGEHVIPADVVAAMGRGSTDAGHKALNDMILKKRAAFRKTLGKLPPPKG